MSFEGLPRPRVVEKEETPSLTRRSFLKWGAATLAVTAIGVSAEDAEAAPVLTKLDAWSAGRAARLNFEEWEALSYEERSKRIEREIVQYREFLQTPAIERILERGTKSQLFAVLHANPGFLTEHLVDSVYEVSKQEWPGISVCRGTNQNGSFDTMSLASGKEVLREKCGGNGFFVSDTMVMTNLHVVRKDIDTLSRAQDWSMPEYERMRVWADDAGVDAILFEAPPSSLYESRRVVQNGFGMHDEDVHGRFVRVPANDPDVTSDIDGTKTYASVAIKLTKHMCDMLAIPQNYTNSFVYIRPPEENVVRQKDSGTSYSYSNGTSGAPVLIGDTVVGINHSGKFVEHKGLGISLGFFNGPEALKKCFEKRMIYRPQEMASSEASNSLQDSKEGLY
jgi:hypothetical protein